MPEHRSTRRDHRDRRNEGNQKCILCRIEREGASDVSIQGASQPTKPYRTATGATIIPIGDPPGPSKHSSSKSKPKLPAMGGLKIPPYKPKPGTSKPKAPSDPAGKGSKGGKGTKKPKPKPTKEPKGKDRGGGRRRDKPEPEKEEKKSRYGDMARAMLVGTVPAIIGSAAHVGLTKLDYDAIGRKLGIVKDKPADPTNPPANPTPPTNPPTSPPVPGHVNAPSVNFPGGTPGGPGGGRGGDQNGDEHQRDSNDARNPNFVGTPPDQKPPLAPIFRQPQPYPGGGFGGAAHFPIY